MRPPGEEALSSGVNTSEINAKIPREVHFDETAAKLLGGMLLVLMICLVGGAWLSYGDISTSHVRNILHRKGRAIFGRVTERTGDHNGVYVKYVFSVDGVLYSGDAEMKTDYIAPKVGGQIPIRYLPDDPHVNLPIGWGWFSAWDIFPVLLLLAYIGIAGAMIISALRARTLARVGLVVEGKVTGCAPHQRLFTTYYEFTTENNISMEGHADLADEFEVGTSIPIIYLRSDPKRNGRYPPRGFYIAD